jgi:hypothetical protein
MDPTKADMLLAFVAYAAFVGVMIVAVALAIVARQVVRMRKKQEATEIATAGELSRMNTSMVSLTQQFSNLSDVTARRFEELANKREMEAMMDRAVTQMGLIALGRGNITVSGSGGADGRSGGATFEGPTDIRGGVAGHDIGKIGKMEGAPVL